MKLTAVNGDVKGQTTNGGVDIDLDGSFWSGEGLDVETTNGGVKLSVPENYSARLEASTNNGGINIDGVNQSRREPRHHRPARVRRRADSRADDEWRACDVTRK